MLHDVLSQYLDGIESAVKSLNNVYIERYEVEILTSDRVNLRIRIRFTQGHLFELNEAVITENENVNHLGYRYHFQDDENKVLFRYDNTPHFPELETFPNHKHLEEKVISSEKPSSRDVILEAAMIIANAINQADI
jgi:hypothetical protein